MTARRVVVTGLGMVTPLGVGVARNWEGIARLEGRGFLLVTDQFPDTILAFVPYP